MYFLLLSTLLLLVPSVLLQDCPQGVTVALSEPIGVLEQGVATFKCVVTVPSGFTLPSEATWHKDYLPLVTTDTSLYTTSSDVKSLIRTDFELKILRAEIEDSGLYSCDPAIAGALCRDSVNFTVNYLVSVIVEDQDAITGDDVVLECFVRGVDPAATWSRYDETTDVFIELNSASGKYTFSESGSEFFLSFSPASSEDTGVYKCEGSANNGRDEGEFNFYSLVAPSGTQIKGGNDDGEFVAFSGDTLILTCDSEGVRAPEYNWTINDVSLEEDTEEIEFNRTSGELTVIGATKFDEGTYTCEAYNKAGSDTAQVIVIIHIVATILGQLNAVSVGLGSEAVLTVTLSASPPIDMVQWTSSSQSVPFTNSTKFTFDFSGTLRISDVTEADDTTYKLKACNTISGLIKCVQSQPISVLVILPSPAPSDLSIELEDRDARTVQISWTNPSTSTRNAPDFYALEVWTSEADDYVLLDEEIPLSAFSGYTLTNLFFGYVNYFRLRGSNLGGLGAASNEINATLSAGVPRIRSVTTDVISSTSINVTFQLWHDGGKPISSLLLQYKENTSSVWTNLTAVFEDDVTYSVIIDGLESATYYNIRLEVSNELGASDFFEPGVKLLPDSVPGTPVLSESDTRLDSVEIAVTLDDFGTGQLLGFFVKYILGSNETIEEISVVGEGLTAGKTFFIEITGLQGEVTYIFSAAGNSTIGLGTYSSDVNIYTDTKFYEHLYFQLSVGIAGALLLLVLVLMCLAVCIGCLCFKYGKKREYSHIYKSRGGADNFALTGDGPEGSEYPHLMSSKPTVTAPLNRPGEDSFSERSTPPIIPPRKGGLFDEGNSYNPIPPLAQYSTVKDPKRAMMGAHYPTDPFSNFLPNKNFLGQDKPPTHSLGNISQGSYITDV